MLAAELTRARLVLVGGYEFTTLQQESQNKHDFWNGSLQWNITPATSVRLFAGGNRPGLKCISGVCRVFPAFQGVKLEVVVRLSAFILMCIGIEIIWNGYSALIAAH